MPVLSEFSSFVVFSPRNKGRGTNSVDYAENVILSVGYSYGEKKGKRIGMQHHRNAFNYLSRFLKGLRKLVPIIKKGD